MGQCHARLGGKTGKTPHQSLFVLGISELLLFLKVSIFYYFIVTEILSLISPVVKKKVQNTFHFEELRFATLHQSV